MARQSPAVLVLRAIGPPGATAEVGSSIAWRHGSINALRTRATRVRLAPAGPKMYAETRPEPSTGFATRPGSLPVAFGGGSWAGGLRWRLSMGIPRSLLETAWEWLTDSLSAPDGDVVLTSPFLTFEICKRIADAACSSPASWHLVTALDPSAVANGYLSVQGLRVMLDAGIEVRHVNRLHAKCFVVGTSGMIGSANLTGAGLGSSAMANRELGVELDPAQTEQARTTILAWPSQIVGHHDLDRLLDESRSLTRTTPRAQHQELDADSALHLAEDLLADARDPRRSLWLKLEYGRPGLDSWRQESWFASPKKGRPGFRPRDLVLICAKHTYDCYAVVEVISEPEFQPKDYVAWTAAEDPDAPTRWPWINRTVPRLVPSALMELKLEELGIRSQGLQNGHVRLKFDQFTAAVRALARLASG